MISVNAENTVRDLLKYKEEVERKLKRMVEGFAYDVTLAAGEKTPIGNAADLDAGLHDYGTAQNRSYAYAYLRRAANTGIPAEVGFHQGAWYYSTTPSSQFIPQIQDISDAADEVESALQSGYKVGDVFYIVASGPGFSTFESGANLQAPDGIMKPTEELIQSTYKINLQDYYNRG
jgi:hypothetical protein